MGIARATKGIIAGRGGGTVYQDIPVCAPEATDTEYTGLYIKVTDLDVSPPQPEAGRELLPRRLSTVPVLPTKTLDNFSPPGNL